MKKLAMASFDILGYHLIGVPTATPGGAIPTRSGDCLGREICLLHGTLVMRPPEETEVRAMASNEFTGRADYDLFLSYNSADHGTVEDIARGLRNEGLEPFLDRWALAPGVRWRSELEKTLASCKAVAIFVGPGEMGSWQQREIDVALDLQSRSPNLPVIPVLLPGCDPPLGFRGQRPVVHCGT